MLSCHEALGFLSPEIKAKNPLVEHGSVAQGLLGMRSLGVVSGKLGCDQKKEGVCNGLEVVRQCGLLLVTQGASQR